MAESTQASLPRFRQSVASHSHAGGPIRLDHSHSEYRSCCNQTPIGMRCIDSALPLTQGPTSPAHMISADFGEPFGSFIRELGAASGAPPLHWGRCVETSMARKQTRFY